MVRYIVFPQVDARIAGSVECYCSVCDTRCVRECSIMCKVVH